jgi:tRNA A-37 threonylcarbamoyl transferase component Bud32
MPEPLPSTTDPSEQPTEPVSGTATCRKPDDGTTLLQPDTPRPSQAEPVPQMFGDYELIQEIARGGMGVVYKARQRTLDRIVALKMILAGRLAGADDLQRFRTEAEAAARLQHANIVTVYEVGEIAGQHFYSMQLVDGQTLAQRLAGGPLPGRTAARYVRQVARAVHFAHRHGILHRDLKPSNIMIDADDEPKVTDFGLAKRLGSGDSGQTRTGAVLGTPSYMSPEQAAGRTKEIGPACDVYALGAVLYELLTGRPPFRAETPLDTVMQVLDNDPVPPRLLNPNVDADLETICLKCLEKDPRARYASADELAEDLQRYLTGESIKARSFNLLDRVSRTLQRSQHDIAFHTWSTMVLIIAAIVLTEHVAVFTLIRTGQARALVMLARACQFGLIGLVFWHNRGRRLLPTTPAERELWTIWIGYIISYGAALLVTRALVASDVSGLERWQDLLVYPTSALLSGLAFFIMGSNYWGACYAVGVAFWVLAWLMPRHLEWAPLEFGLLWSAVLTMLGLHLRRLGKRAEAERQLANLSPSDVPTVLEQAAKKGDGKPGVRECS